MPPAQAPSRVTARSVFWDESGGGWSALFGSGVHPIVGSEAKPLKVSPDRDGHPSLSVYSKMWRDQFDDPHAQRGVCFQRRGKQIFGLAAQRPIRTRPPGSSLKKREGRSA